MYETPLYLWVYYSLIIITITALKLFHLLAHRLAPYFLIGLIYNRNLLLEPVVFFLRLTIAYLGLGQ